MAVSWAFNEVSAMFSPLEPLLDVTSGCSVTF